jgi:hypothetical protein
VNFGLLLEAWQIFSSSVLKVNPGSVVSGSYRQFKESSKKKEHSVMQKRLKTEPWKWNWDQLPRDVLFLILAEFSLAEMSTSKTYCALPFELLNLRQCNKLLLQYVDNFCELMLHWNFKDSKSLFRNKTPQQQMIKYKK